MTLVRADEVRTSIVANMKANATITALLSDTDEVREFNWKGTEFSYPNYRVRINTLPPVDDCYQEMEVSIFCFSEQASSQQAEEMAGTVANEYHDKGFTQSGITFSHLKADIIPAIQQDAKTWRSEVILRSPIK
ncbi:MAG: hypothetical protein ACXADH_18945 [Candidatus Kariarchaeaceae archaeon]|jgi:hypothetical protein